MTRQSSQEKNILRRDKEKDLQQYIDNLIEKGVQWDCATHKILGEPSKRFWWAYHEISFRQ